MQRLLKLSYSSPSVRTADCEARFLVSLELQCEQWKERPESLGGARWQRKARQSTYNAFTIARSWNRHHLFYYFHHLQYSRMNVWCDSQVGKAGLYVTFSDREKNWGRKTSTSRCAVTSRPQDLPRNRERVLRQSHFKHDGWGIGAIVSHIALGHSIKLVFSNMNRNGSTLWRGL